MRKAVQSLSRLVIRQAIEHTESRLLRFFEPSIVQLELLCGWGQAGLLDLASSEKLNDVFVPLMEQHGHISSVMLADEAGREYMLLRQGRQWMNRQKGEQAFGKRVRITSWSDFDNQPKTTWEKLDYDPRERPWFIGAMAKRTESNEPANQVTQPSVYWTQPYEFFTTKEPGITVSMRYTGPDGKAHVLGFDILLNDISRFTTQMQVLEAGVVMVLADDRRVIGLPNQMAYQSDQGRTAALLKRPLELDSPLIKDASQAFRSNIESGEAFDDPLRFVSGEVQWWGAAKVFQLAPDRYLIISVVVPEVDLLGNLTESRIWILLITLGILVMAIWRAVVLARRYSRPIEALVLQSDRMSQGNLEPGEPVVSTVKEVRLLADAHEHMRLGLQTLMKLESDLQLARQIQQQTFPRRLVKLAGYDIDAWNQPADETGGDTYDVIGFQYGADGRTVCLTDCQADRALFFLADATGHGIGPALSATQVRAMLRMAVRNATALDRLIVQLNEQLHADLPEGRFITAWLGLLDTSSHRLTCFSAGQAPLLHYAAQTGQTAVLSSDTYPFGITEEVGAKLAEPVAMARGDIYAVISDGIFESANSDSELFGTERVVEVIKRCSKRSASEILKAIREAVLEYTQSAPAADDRTILIIKRN